MKKITRFAFVCMMLMPAASLFAQKQFDLVLKSGISVPNLSSGSSDNPVTNGYRSRLGYDGALALEWHLSGNFSIEPQLEYSQQGGKKNGYQAFSVPADLVGDFPPGHVPPYLYADYRSTAKMNYLLLPVLAKHYFYTGNHWRTYLAAGPFVGWLLSAHNVSSGSAIVYTDAAAMQPLSSNAVSFDKDEDVKADLHAWNAGVSGHVGLCYPLARGAVFFEAGGNYGFVNIQKDAANGTNKTGAAVIDLGYQFRL